MENSNINWTDHTWNPWVGCRHVSPEYREILHGVVKGIQDELRDKFNEFPQQEIAVAPMIVEGGESGTATFYREVAQ